jgi:hypothetical protein
VYVPEGVGWSLNQPKRPLTVDRKPMDVSIVYLNMEGYSECRGGAEVKNRWCKRIHVMLIDW